MVEANSTGDLTGRTVVVTGASSGIGWQAAIDFARRGAQVVLVGRDRARLEAALKEVRDSGVGTEPAAYRSDFAELAQVRELAQTLSAYPRIHVLANNAGAAISRRQTTVDGFELTIQANHLAPFLLTHLVRDQLVGGRVITTASDAHRGGALDPADLNSTARRYRTLGVYGSSKQANILFAAEAARRWPDILSTSYHPGVVRTRFGRDSAVMSAFYKVAPGLRSPQRGADTLLWLAEATDDQLVNGGYYVDRRLTRPSEATADSGLAARLWQASLAAVGLDPS